MSNSKYFYEAAKDLTCSDIHFANNCWSAAWWNLTKTIPGCFKFVFPVIFLPVLTRGNNLNRDVLKQSGKIFLEYFLGSWIISGVGLSLICLFYNLLGKFYYLSAVAIPGACSTAICSLLLSDKVINLYSHAVLTLMIEISIKRGDTIILKYIRKSTFAITLAFMLLNTILLHVLRNSKLDIFWILQPFKNREIQWQPSTPSPILESIIPCPNKVCHHKLGCDSYIYDGLKTYLKIGISVEIIRKAITNFAEIRKYPFKFASIIGRDINYNLMAFIVCYVGGYRLLNCIINRLEKKNSDNGHMISSFLCAAAFSLYPNHSIFSHTAATTIECLLKYLMESYMDASPILQQINRIPISRIFFPFGLAYLFHSRFFTPWLAPEILKTTMHIITGNKDTKIYSKYYSRLGL